MCVDRPIPQSPVLEASVRHHGQRGRSGDTALERTLPIRQLDFERSVAPDAAPPETHNTTSQMRGESSRSHVTDAMFLKYRTEVEICDELRARQGAEDNRSLTLQEELASAQRSHEAHLLSEKVSIQETKLMTAEFS